MPKKSKDELLSELLKKQEAIKNRIASLEARKRKEEDKLLTRKKILIGAHLLEKYKDNAKAMNQLVKELDGFLKRPHDRRLFNLPLLTEES